VLSGRGLCDELITLPEESYRLWHVVCDVENLLNEEALAHWGLRGKNKYIYEGKSISKLQIAIEKKRMGIMTYKQHLFFNVISVQI
jgi:hypothetical protein